jgi:hypothetical protein
LERTQRRTPTGMTIGANGLKTSLKL